MNFAALIAPWSIDQFRDELWGRRLLHLTGCDRPQVEGLVTGEQMRRLLFAGDGLPPDAVHVARGTSRHATPVLSASGLALTDPAQLEMLFHSGLTIMVEQVDRFVPQIASWARDISLELRVRTQVHLVVSPGSDSGFAPHSDGYGVFAWQVEGSKLWSIYGDVPVEAPRHGVDRHELLERAPTQQILTNAGDRLYLPRGLVHAAASREGGSVHLSLSIVPATGVDLISLLAAAAKDDPGFTQEVPLAIHPDSTRTQEYFSEFSDRLKRLIDTAAWPEILDARLAQD